MADPRVLVLDNPSALHSPDGLADVLRAMGLPVARVARMDAEAMPAGYSRSVLTRLTLRVESPGAGACWDTHLIVKDVAPLHGWLGSATADTRVREVQLWRTGLLADLPRVVVTGAMAVAYDGAPEAPRAGALLLDDLRSRLLRHPLNAPRPRSSWLLHLLDALAQMHATFWEDPRLYRPEAGLTPAREALLLTAPNTVAARLAEGDPDAYLAGIPGGWDAFLAAAPSWAADALGAALAEPERYVRAIECMPTTLVHGDVWGPNLGRLPSARLRSGVRVGRRMLLLDWALATAGPCTYDVLWLCGTWHGLDPQRTMAAYRSRLMRHLERRGRRLDASKWRELVDAGYLRTVLVCGEAFGRAVARAHAGAQRTRAERRAHWWAARGALAARRLRERASIEHARLAPARP